MRGHDRNSVYTPAEAQPSIGRMADRVPVVRTPSAAGAPPGRYTIGTIELEVGADQIVRQPGKPNFAGSALRPIDGITRAAAMLGKSWREVWPHFSQHPAQLMGLRNEIAVGQPADFCVVATGADGRVTSARLASA